MAATSPGISELLLHSYQCEVRILFKTCSSLCGMKQTLQLSGAQPHPSGVWSLPASLGGHLYPSYRGASYGGDEIYCSWDNLA